MSARHITSIVSLVLAICWPRHIVDAASMTAASPSSSRLNSDVDGFMFANDDFATMVAEFAFNVAGDHILYPAPPNQKDDERLHKNAVILAAMLQKLHITERLCRLLNDTAHDAIADKSITIDNSNLINIVLDKAIEKIALDRELLEEFFECGGEQESISLAANHAKFAPSEVRVQSMYDLSSDQFIHAAELLDDRRVKKLVMSVSIIKASDYDIYRFTPATVRENTKLAKNILILASRVELRDRIQRIYDDTLDECADKFDVISGDVRGMFDTLRAKLSKDSVLKKELEILN